MARAASLGGLDGDRHGSRGGSDVQANSGFLIVILLLILVAILLRACTSNGINPVAQTSVTADDNPPSVPFDPTTVVEPAALPRSGQPTCQLVVTSRVRLIVFGWLLPRLPDNP